PTAAGIRRAVAGGPRSSRRGGRSLPQRFDGKTEPHQRRFGAFSDFSQRMPGVKRQAREAVPRQLADAGRGVTAGGAARGYGLRDRDARGWNDPEPGSGHQTKLLRMSTPESVDALASLRSILVPTLASTGFTMSLVSCRRDTCTALIDQS